MDELPIGRRVAYWRGRRRLSQQVFADRLGKSKSWVDKVERGVRRLDKFSVIQEIAEVLQLDVPVLMGHDPVRRPDTVNCIDQVELDEIRAALERYEPTGPLHQFSPESPPLAEVRKSVDYAWQTYSHVRYVQLAQMLPQLLRDAQAANAAYDGDEGRVAAHLLGQVYQIASSALRKVGEYELAWHAADRAVAAAQRAGDELLVGVATHRIGMALVAGGRNLTALEVTVNAANQLAIGPGQDSDKRQSVYGVLLLQAAMAAARLGHSATVSDLIAAADVAAAQVGPNQNHYWTSFGPTNVAFYRAATATEMGEGGRALETNATITQGEFDAMIPERRAHHLLDLSRALTQVGAIDKAGETLVEAARMAPAEIRCRPLAHEVMLDVIRRSRGVPPAPVAELAEQIGVGV
ncbi:MAG: helix-turn-helix domain-containing protein [Micromonosporaceae bacterium]